MEEKQMEEDVMPELKAKDIFVPLAIGIGLNLLLGFDVWGWHFQYLMSL